MRKKKPPLQLPKKKAIMLTAVILSVGIFVLFASILFAPGEKKENTVQKESPSSIEKSEKPSVSNNEEEPIEEKIPASEPPKKVLEEKPSSIKEGRLAFVFDDAGNNVYQINPFINLPFPVTIAVLPSLPHSKETAQKIREAGKAVFLHQPMQAVNRSINPGPGAILPNMDSLKITQQLLKNIQEIGPISGMNNHEGSLITSDRYAMGVVLDVCSDEDILFVDSRTNAKSVVSLCAKERGMPLISRDIFLDNSKDRFQMEKMLKKGLEVADKQGYAVMIGHVFTPELAQLLTDFYPELKMQGYRFVTVKELYTFLYGE